MNAPRSSSLLAWCLASLLAACGGSTMEATAASSNAEGEAQLVNVSYTLAQPSLVLGVNSLVLHVTDVSGAPVDGAEVAVSLFMPTHGHGSSAMPIVTPQGSGVYDIENVVFTMPGTWELTVHVTQGALNDTATLTLDVP